VHRQTVSRLVLKDYRRSDGIYLTHHVPTRKAAARDKFDHLLEELTVNS
jgi:acyl-CoA dehydrogenase